MGWIDSNGLFIQIFDGWEPSFAKPARFHLRSRAVLSFEMEWFFHSVAIKLFLSIGVGNAPHSMVGSPSFAKPTCFRLRSRVVLSFEMELFFRSVAKKLFLSIGVGNAPHSMVGSRVLRNQRVFACILGWF